MPVAPATIAKRKETMEKNKLAGVVRKPRTPMSTEAKAIMAAKRKHTLNVRAAEQQALIQEQQALIQKQQEQPQLNYHEMINEPSIKKRAYFHLFELERTKGVIPFTDYVDSLMLNLNFKKNIAEHFTVHFIVLNQSIKAEYGVNQPDPRLSFMFTN